MSGMMPFTTTVAPGFDHPLEMLHACHGKILLQCETLEKLAVHLAEHGSDKAARQAAQGILRYFDTAGKFHHQDEELDLFPALRTCIGPDNAELESLLAHLLSEHTAMVSAWDELRVALLDIADGISTALPRMLLDRFIDSHRAHIACEESELLPMAEIRLDSRQIQALGETMSRRRGVKSGL